MLRLLLVRHGQSEWNAQHRYQGHSDVPLDQNGLDQAYRLAMRLKSEHVDQVFTSDLQRARKTAEIISAGWGLNIQQDLRLRELSFGVLEGYTFEEGLKCWPEMISTWVNDQNQPPTGGERMDDFAERVSQFFEEIQRDWDGKTVLIVAHGGPLRLMIQSVLDVRGDVPVWFNLDNGSLSDLQFDDENVIINRINDTGHLKSI